MESKARVEARIEAKYKPATALFEDFKLIGQGSFGTVFKGKTKVPLGDIPVGTLVAVKVIPSSNISKSNLDILGNEIRTLRTLSSFIDNKNNCHQNIVCYYGKVLILIKSIEYFGIVMEYVPGYSLTTYIESLEKYQKGQGEEYDILGAMTNEQIANLMKQLLNTLDYMHSLDIVHRDIKSDNIIYDPDTMIIKYIDFGFACFDTLSKGGSKGGVEGQCKVKGMGTPSYIAPEIWGLNIKPVRNLLNEDDIKRLKASDVWSLGAVLYELLFGDTPFGYVNSAAELTVELISSDPVKFPPFYGDSVLVDVVKLMLNKDYKNRITAGEAFRILK